MDNNFLMTTEKHIGKTCKFTCKGCKVKENGKVANSNDLCKPCEREVNQHIKRICEGNE